MARLVDWPVGLYPTSMEPLSGPRSVGGGSTTGSTGFVQTFASPFGLWKWQFSLPPMRGRMFRRYRGMVAALHAGANAVRFPFMDPDAIDFRELGVAVPRDVWLNGVLWGNGQSWANGQRWTADLPIVPVAAAANVGDTSVEIAATSWGAMIGIGDLFGFVDSFGVYIVTRVNSDGSVTIWPPLRAAVDTTTFATLKPDVAFKLEGEASANLSRGLEAASNLTITLIEVEHQDVIDFFGD